MGLGIAKCFSVGCVGGSEVKLTRVSDSCVDELIFWEKDEIC